MLRIEVKEGENIDRALKRYKRKRQKVKLRERIQDNKHFEKASDARRKLVQKAKYKQEYLNETSDE